MFSVSIVYDSFDEISFIILETHFDDLISDFVVEDGEIIIPELYGYLSEDDI